MDDSKPVLKPAIFMHIQKTAGTSIVHSASKYYGSNNIISHGDHLDGWSEFPLKDKFFDSNFTQCQFGHVPFISGHFGYDFAKPFLKTRYSFTFLRNPIERIISLFHFCRTRDPNEFRIYRVTQEYSFNDFLSMGFAEPEIKACIWNNLTWQLAHGYGNSNGLAISSFSEDDLLNLAIQHLNDFTYIGFCESFSVDHGRILNDLGIPLPEKHAVHNVTPNRPTIQEIPKTTLRLLEDLTQLDHALYAKAWALKEAHSDR